MTEMVEILILIVSKDVKTAIINISPVFKKVEET